MEGSHKLSHDEMVYIVDKVNRNLATKPANARKHRNQLTNLDQALKLRIVEDNYNVPLLVKTAQFINFMYLRRLASSLDQGTTPKPQTPSYTL